MSGKSRAPTRVPEQNAVGPEQQAPESVVGSNAQAVAMMPMPPVLPTLGYEILDHLDASFGESEVDLGPIDHSGTGVNAEPVCEPNGQPSPPVDPATCPPLDPADAAILQELAELLTFSRYTDRITRNEIDRAQNILGGLSACGLAQFRELRGGVLADRLINNPEGEGWVANPIGSAADNPGGLLAAARSWWAGDSALEAMQAGMGGSIEGVTLDTSGANEVDVATNLPLGKLQVTVPNLSIASIRHAADGAVVTSGPGTVIRSEVLLDLPDKASSDLNANVKIHSVDWTGLSVKTDAMTATISKLLISKVVLAAVQASIDPQVLAKATAAPALARAAMVSQMVPILIPELNALSALMSPLVYAAAKAAEDTEVAMREAFELGAVDAMDVGVSIGEISLPQGVSVTSLTSDGASSTTDIDSLTIQDLEIGLMQVDRLDALRNEAYNLTAQLGPLDPLDQTRLDSVVEQIDELEPKAARRTLLESQGQSRSLTEAETTELTLLKRDLSAGLMQVTMEALDVHGITMDGTAVDDVTLMDLDVTALGSALAYRLQDSATPQEASDSRAASLDGIVARENNAPILPAPADKDAPLWSLPETMEDMGFEGTLGLFEAGGVETTSGSTDHAAASFMDFRGNADVMGVQATDVQADGLDAMGLTADHARGSNADIRVSGNDIGGIIEQASGEGIHYASDDMTADMQTGQAGAIRFDADAGTKRLRTGSIDQGSATGLDYEDAGQHVVAASASAQTIEARGATASGIDSLTVASGQAADGSYRRHAAPERVGEDGQTIEAVTGMDAAFDAAQIADLRVSDATKAGTGTVDLASLEAQGVSGGMDGTGSGSAEMVSMSTIHASRDSNGELNASIEEAMAGGLDGQMPGTATADATILELQGFRASGDADGNYTANADLGHIFNVDANVVGRGEGSVDRIDLTDLRGEMNADGSMGGSADVVATDLEGSATGYGEGAADQLTLQRAGGRMNADGTAVVDTEGGSVTNLTGTYAEDLQDPTATGGVDEIGFGYAGLALDADRNVTGAEVNDLTGAGISVELLKLPLDEVSEEAAATELFHAEALTGMSGTVEIGMPVLPSGLMIVSGTAEDGFIKLSELRVRYEGSLPLPARALGRSIQVDEGRGLVVGLGPINIKCLVDDRTYDGLISSREGGGRRGSVSIAALLEGMMNAEVEDTTGSEEQSTANESTGSDESSTEPETLRQRRHARRNARDRRKAERKETESPDGPTTGEDEATSLQATIEAAAADRQVTIRRRQYGVMPSQTRIVSASVDLGSGALGYDSMSVSMRNTDTDSFQISGSLAESVRAQTDFWGADDATYQLSSGEPIAAEKLGLTGVKLEVDRPLETSRQVRLAIADGSVQRIAFGDNANDQE